MDFVVIAVGDVVIRKPGGLRMDGVDSNNNNDDDDDNHKRDTTPRAPKVDGGKGLCC